VAPGRLRRDETNRLDVTTVRQSGGSVRRHAVMSWPEKGSAATSVSSMSYGEGERGEGMLNWWKKGLEGALIGKGRTMVALG
jgi:hypothetical protein